MFVCCERGAPAPRFENDNLPCRVKSQQLPCKVNDRSRNGVNCSRQVVSGLVGPRGFLSGQAGLPFTPSSVPVKVGSPMKRLEEKLCCKRAPTMTVYGGSSAMQAELEFVVNFKPPGLRQIVVPIKIEGRGITIRRSVHSFPCRYSRIPRYKYI